MTETIAPLSSINCSKCGVELSATTRYCSKCGNKVEILKELNAKKEIWKFLLSFFAVVIYILSLYFFQFEGNFGTSLIIDILFVFLVGILVYVFRAEIKPFVNINSLKFTKLFKYISFQIVLTAFTLISFYGIKTIIHFEESNVLGIYINLPIPILFATFFTSVLPAITEEITFRAILYVQLEKLTSGKSAVIITGLLFALVHFSFLSFIWLIPAGIFLGWIRLKEKTIWYGVFCHFMHNFIILMIEFLS